MVETKPDTLNTSAEGDHDPHYEPIVTLPLKEIRNFEEDENELFKMHAKIFRWASESDPPEWKERGSGDVKFLQHKETKRVRLLMRRDKTLKLCANHFVDEYMKLEPHCGSERAWLYKAFADFSDDEPKPELLVIRFYNAERATEFKEMFDKCIEINKNLPKIEDQEEQESTEKPETTQESKETAEKSKETTELESATENLEALKIEKGDKTENNDEKKTENGEKTPEKYDGKVETTKTESSPEK
uniref:ran-specific GTPase-activating protein-like n=1 Tax=Styela clava TaxID=7725 RepID=UPI00193A6F29|nr:ran-specific GTPase-activating protein-like [Styela clava]